jgi:3-dehydroquinate synthase
VSRDRIDVAIGDTTYRIVIQPGVVPALDHLLDEVGFPRHRVLVSSPRVWKHQGEHVAAALRDTAIVLIPDGERAKTVSTAGRIHDALIAQRADRGTGLVAVGGGVIGDVAGFAAATYLRGIAIAHVPTTLLAQVDSAVGGKVGVNHRLGKNLIGAFHQPRLVVVDPTVLRTLPMREFRAGLYEVVKYGMAFDAGLFERVRQSLPGILRRDVDVLAPIIGECCRIKARVVMEDERERGPRRLLNFGHTAGHAFEAVTSYRRFRHGEAIAWGMRVAAEVAVARGALDPAARDRLDALIAALGPLPTIADLSLDDVLAAMRRDKKVVDGRLHYVLATSVGHADVVDTVTEPELRTALDRIVRQSAISASPPKLT